MQQNIWQKLKTSQKLSFLGSGLLLISLFLNWYSDKDVFRSGDSYTAMSGPLYFVGFTMLIMALFVIATVFLSSRRSKLLQKWTTSGLGKIQMLTGFSAMYLLMVINSVYFHPQFGLNILDKKSEIGVMVALVATVMICIGGYLTYRSKPGLVTALDSVIKEDSTSDVTAEPTPPEERTHTPINQTVPVPAPVAAVSGKTNPVTTQASTAIPQTTEAPKEPITPHQPAVARSSRAPTEYEKAKLYENLKKTMIRDTLTPQQRKKERAKEIKTNAFSASFGTGEKYSGSKSNASKDSDSGKKKPQMYRLDL
jgi:hypothetical protein